MQVVPPDIEKPFNSISTVGPLLYHQQRQQFVTMFYTLARLEVVSLIH